MKRLILAASIPLLATACNDDPLGLFPVEAEPSRLELSAVTPELVEGETTELRFRLLDGTGQEIEQLPHWVQPVWSASDGAILRVREGIAESVAPGFADAQVRVGDRVAAMRMRVNASAVTLRVDEMHLNQAVQRYTGGVPIIANRDAILRVFVTAEEVNRITTIPPARIELFMDGQQVHSETVTATGFSEIPNDPMPGSLSGSWNVHVPLTLVRPGLSVRVEIDPEFTVPRRSGDRVFFPTSGQPRRITVSTVPRFYGRMVPIHQSHFGSTGYVTEENVDDYLVDFVRMFPIEAYDVDVREPFVTNARSGDETDWYTIIQEVEALRRAEGSGRYYYGVVRGHNSQIAGIAYIGEGAQSPRTSLGIDFNTHPTFPTGVHVHELGHNFGRRHAPCGNPGGVDPNYPYSGGSIGHYGYDVATNQLIRSSTADLMGYCRPTWVSDYTYAAVYAYRNSFSAGPLEGASGAAARADRVGESLLVWGRIENGVPVLDPSFELREGLLSHEEPQGNTVIRAFDRGGRELLTFRFTPPELGHGDRDVRPFVHAIPASPDLISRIATLRIEAPAGADEIRLQRRALEEPHELEARLHRSARGAELSWRAEAGAAALVRSVATGNIIAIARDGRARLPADVGEVEVEVSVGTRSVRVPVLPN
jgi:hypothetical protein